MKRFPFYVHMVLFIAIALCQFGCLPWRLSPLVYFQEDFKADNVDSITVLPLTDARRPEQDTGLDYDKECEGVQELLREKLKEKGYTVKDFGGEDALGNIQPGQIPFLDADRIREIGPDDARWVLLPTVTRFGYDLFGTPTAEIVCYLYEKPTGKLGWEGSVTSDKGKGPMKQAVELLMVEFPFRK